MSTAHVAGALAADVRKTSEGARTVVVLSGRLDGGTVGGLWDRAADAVAGARSAVTLDCARVDYLDGSGAAMLVMMRDRAARSGGSVSIRGLSDELQRILEMTWACEEPKWTVEKERRALPRWWAARPRPPTMISSTPWPLPVRSSPTSPRACDTPAGCAGRTFCWPAFAWAWTACPLSS
ncbi:STAS domain-containing protein [Salidesulfovibrio brasiliensis]|uniref:STAS domain-containing protein n=1 Tax=Salidesulfovibrio brasiliensis TaxID=221711 RepID=UPI001FDF9B64|nr:STAS domain-containing protein [Salidesulfovibrio brasiliensis]